MKTIQTGRLLLAALLISTAVSAKPLDPDSTGLPGDNFNLEAALDLFKKSSSPEDFEKRLNSNNNDVNNLDLNEDGETDYIKVIDRTEAEVHAFVLQAIVSETENQDIAVIEIEKDGASSASLQIVGDEDIYGEETIVEPIDEDKAALQMVYDPAKANGPSLDFGTNAVVVNVWFWPSVRYVYAPGYRIWVSPFRWRAYPSWWRPWRPVGFAVWHPRRVHYRSRYAVVPTHRMVHAHRVYRPARVSSVTVTRRHSVSVNRYRATTTRKTTVVKGPRGNKAVKTTRHTKVRRRH